MTRNPTRILICGSRSWADPFPIRLVLSACKRLGGRVLIHGGAGGADNLANAYGRSLRYEVQAFPAEWERYGKPAGFIRNRRMLDVGKPDVVFAFRADGRSPGTDMMRELARNAGIPVYVIRKD